MNAPETGPHPTPSASSIPSPSDPAELAGGGRGLAAGRDGGPGHRVLAVGGMIARTCATGEGGSQIECGGGKAGFRIHPQEFSGITSSGSLTMREHERCKFLLRFVAAGKIIRRTGKFAAVPPDGEGRTMVRSEVSISLSIHWNPSVPLETRDIPTVRNFLSAVKAMMRVPGNGVSLSGPVSMLEAAFASRIPGASTAIEAVEETPTGSWRDGQIAMIRRALADNRGNRTHAAKQLGISVRTLRNRLNQYGLTDLRSPGPVPKALTETTA